MGASVETVTSLGHEENTAEFTNTSKFVHPIVTLPTNKPSGSSRFILERQLLTSGAAMVYSKAEGKICYILKRYPRLSETFIVNEILAHEAAGYEIEIFSLYPPDDGHFQDFISAVQSPVHYVPSVMPKAVGLWNAWKKSAGSLPDFWQRLGSLQQEEVRYIYQGAIIAREAVKTGVTHIHAHFGGVAATVARIAAYFADLPYTFTMHAKDIFQEAVNWQETERNLQNADSVITVSDFNARHLRNMFPFYAEKVRRIYNGLNLDLLQFDPPHSRPNRVVGIGRLIPKKGFSDLVEACRILVQRGIDFQCSLIGHGELSQELRSTIRELGLQSRVELTGPLPQNEVLAHLGNACVLVAPCVVAADGDRDGLPTVLLEAMAIGTPCVSTDVTGIPEIIRHAETGLMVPQHSPAYIADAIQTLFDNQSIRLKIAEQARATIENEFDIDINTSEIRLLFHSASRERFSTVGS